VKAVVLTKSVKACEVEISNVLKPRAKRGWVLIKVMAFGLNNSEKVLREFEIENDYIKKPIIPGIECVGLVENASNSKFSVGDKVIALMGGMGRSFDGSYAEFCLVPERNVFKIDSDLPFEKLAAIPETFFTAYGSLFESLALKKGEILFIRGGTCALGYAAIQLAKAVGAKVIATANKREKLNSLAVFGADFQLLDDKNLAENIKKIAPNGVDKILELVGAKTLLESLTFAKTGGIVCHTGVLGKVYGLRFFDPIKDIPNGVYLTGFFSNYPTQEKVNEIFEFLKKHKIEPKVGKIFDFENITDAVVAQDKGSVNGKIVVRVSK
jgi:NADPH:quinone reductase-like Zn-dependent oxidoreductase